MRLRQTVATPERFDETVFRVKRRDPTRPQHPELLAAQVVPYRPDNKAAAFPSLSLGFENSHDDIVEQSHNDIVEQSHDGRSLTTETTKPPQNKSVCESDIYCTQKASVHKREDTLDTISRRDGATDWCNTCNQKLGIDWDSLSLAVKLHIFHTFLQTQRYPEIVACTLQLTHQQLDDLKYRINLRRIHHAPLETIWKYGATIGCLGDGIINPEDIEGIMDHLLFSGQYENADDAEIQHGKDYLKQLHLDDKIMNSFEESDREQHTKRMAASETKPQVALKQDHSGPVSDIKVDPAKGDNVYTSKDVPATAPAPASISTFDDADLKAHTSLSDARMPAIHHPSEERQSGILRQEQAEKPKRKRLRLNIDEIGHASIVAEDDDEEPVQLGVPSLDSALVRPAPSTDDVGLASHGTRTHAMHNPRAFATHFNHAAFPQEEKQRLLSKNPKQMSNLEHWFVYGTPWRFLEYMTEFGRVREPQDKDFDPRKTQLDESEVESDRLRNLVNLHNIWVRRSTWFHGDCKANAQMFGSLTESVMESSESDKDAQLTPTTASFLRLRFDAEQEDRERQRRKMAQRENLKDRAPMTDNSILKQSIVHHPAVNAGYQPSHPPTIARDDHQRIEKSKASHDLLLRKVAGEWAEPDLPSERAFLQGHDTPDDKAIEKHTGDTTIDILGASNIIRCEGPQGIEPGSARRKLFDAANENPDTEWKALGGSVNVCQPLQTTDQTYLHNPGSDNDPHPVPHAPSYSPISDQESQTLPTWSRHKKQSDELVETAAAPLDQMTRSAYELSKNAGIQRNNFLQGIIDAAAEDVLGTPATRAVGLGLHDGRIGSLMRREVNASTALGRESPVPLQGHPVARNEIDPRLTVPPTAMFTGTLPAESEVRTTPMHGPAILNSQPSKQAMLKPTFPVTNTDEIPSTPPALDAATAPSSKKKRKDAGVKRGPYKKRGDKSTQAAADVNNDKNARTDGNDTFRQDPVA